MPIHSPVRRSLRTGLGALDQVTGFNFKPRSQLYFYDFVYTLYIHRGQNRDDATKRQSRSQVIVQEIMDCHDDDL